MSQPTRWWVAVALACLSVSRVYAAEQAALAPAAPEVQVNRLLEYFKASQLLGGYRGPGLGELFAAPGDQSQLWQYYRYLSLYALFGGPAPGAEVTGDTAKVLVPAQPMTFCLKQVNGKWVIDMAATIAAMPPAVRNMVLSQQCMSALSRIAAAARQYSDKHAGSLPLAESWREDLLTLMGGAEAAKSARCPLAPLGVAGYALNEALSGKPLKTLDRAETTVLFYESDQEGLDPAGGPATLAEPRHDGGNYYVMANFQLKYSKEPLDFTYRVKAPPPVNAAGPPPR
jgi:hypothetical protein